MMAVVMATLIGLSVLCWNQGEQIGRLQRDISAMDVSCGIQNADSKRDLDIRLIDVKRDMVTINDGHYASFRLMSAELAKLKSKIETLECQINVLTERPPASANLVPYVHETSDFQETRERLDQEIRFGSIENKLRDIEAAKQDAEREASLRRILGK